MLDEATERVAEGTIEKAIDGLIESWADDRSAQQEEQLKAQHKEHLTIKLLELIEGAVDQLYERWMVLLREFKALPKERPMASLQDHQAHKQSFIIVGHNKIDHINIKRSKIFSVNESKISFHFQLWKALQRKSVGSLYQLLTLPF